jgi:hypothetical protein
LEPNHQEQYGDGYRMHIECTPGFHAHADRYLQQLCKGEARRVHCRVAVGQMEYSVGKDPLLISRLFADLHLSGAGNHITSWGITQAKFEDAYLKLLADDRRSDGEDALQCNGDGDEGLKTE